MVPRPQALALTLCERVIIEQGKRNPSLIGIFMARSVEQFPSEAVAFSAFAAVMGGRGTGIVELVAIRLATDEQIYSQRGEVTFPDRRAVIHAHFRVSGIRFPEAGSYEFMLLVDGDLIAQTRLLVDRREDAA
jgi:hypothetical protein